MTVFFDLKWYKGHLESEHQKSNLHTSVFQPFESHSTLKGLLKHLAAPKVLNDTLNVKIRSNVRRNVITCGTPSTSMRHPRVSRHPGWEPLLYMIPLKGHRVGVNWWYIYQ